MPNSIEYLTKNVWNYHRAFFRDLDGNNTEFTSIEFREDCAINNTHTFLTNQLYIGYEECYNPPEDTMYWQYNEENNHLEYHSYKGHSEPEDLLFEYEIEKLNETELILVSASEYDDDGSSVEYYRIN